MRVGVYIRVSKGDGSQVPENQLQQMQGFIAAQNWKIFRVYRDTVSAKSDDRPAFQKMLADAENRRFDVLLFWSLDRLSRQGALATLLLLDRLSQWGIGFRSYTEQYLDSCNVFKDAVVSILATIAKQERIRLSERTRAGLEWQKQTGRPGPHGRLGPGRPPVSIDHAKVKALYAQVRSYAKVGKAFGVSKATAFRLLQEKAS